MVNLDSSVVNVALPVLEHRFAVPIGTVQWVVSVYLLVITGLVPLVGRLADRFGRREIFLAGLGLFLLGSVLCAMAASFPELIEARIVQGIGGATIMANVMAIIALIFPKERRSKALGLISSVVAAGTLAGPPLGGLLIASTGWRSIFWINVPIGLWGIWGTYRYLPKFARMTGRVDWTGALLFLGGMACFQWGLGNIGQIAGIGALLCSALIFAFFVRIQKKVETPVVPLHLFRIRPFSRNLWAGFVYWILMMFPAFLMPFFLLEELHLPVSVIGFSLVPQALVMIVVSPLGGTWADRIGTVIPGRVALMLFAGIDATLATIPAHPPLWEIWVLLGSVGLAAGLFSSPNNTAMLNSVDRSDMGVVSGLTAIQRNLGRVVGVELATLLMSLIWVLQGIGFSPSHDNPHYATWFLQGFHGVFWVGAGVAVLGMMLVVNPEGGHGD